MGIVAENEDSDDYLLQLYHYSNIIWTTTLCPVDDLQLRHDLIGDSNCLFNIFIGVCQTHETSLV